jgi:hypothetical protein
MFFSISTPARSPFGLFNGSWNRSSCFSTVPGTVPPVEPFLPSFLDMLTTLRRQSIRDQFLSLRLSGEGSRKALQALENAISLAV